MFFPEYFSREGLNHRALLPCVERQAGFAASLFEEGDAVPLVFDRYLRQEEASMSSHTDEQSVAPHFHFFRWEWVRG